MTLGEMRTLLRLRVNDVDSSRWTDTQIDTELNSAARFVARSISRYQKVNYFASTESFTTSGQTKVYALAATDIRRVFKMIRNESNFQEPCRPIDELDRLDHYETRSEIGEWFYYMTRSATTKLWSVNFPHVVPSGMTFLVQYILRLPNLTAGGSSSQEYTSIDDDYHEMVVQRAVIMLLGPDSAGLQAATQYYADLEQQMKDDLGAATEGYNIQDEFVRAI